MPLPRDLDDPAMVAIQLANGVEYLEEADRARVEIRCALPVFLFRHSCSRSTRMFRTAKPSRARARSCGKTDDLSLLPLLVTLYGGVQSGLSDALLVRGFDYYAETHPLVASRFASRLLANGAEGMRLPNLLSFLERDGWNDARVRTSIC